MLYTFYSPSHSLYPFALLPNSRFFSVSSHLMLVTISSVFPLFLSCSTRSRMLAIAAALSRSSQHHHRTSASNADSSQDSVLTRTSLTLAASLSCASPFDFRAARDPSSEASRTGKSAFESTDGDPFTARRAFEV